jgi:hypothetical protein
MLCRGMIAGRSQDDTHRVISNLGDAVRAITALITGSHARDIQRAGCRLTLEFSCEGTNKTSGVTRAILTSFVSGNVRWAPGRDTRILVHGE